MPANLTSKLPVEVELALEVMPCQAMRRSYDSSPEPHPCAYFAEWGDYHSYDYEESGPPDQPSTALPVVYAGKRPLVPELLSGCRKSPILCVGINPNLPGWTRSTRNAVHPYFDDVLQYAHYFRYRTRDKLRINGERYEALIGTRPDGPRTAHPLVPEGDPIEAERSPVLMYQQYQTLLDGLAQRKAWTAHRLAVGEDIAYANMVACPSTRWVVTANEDDPEMPVMGAARAAGIVGECFFERRYFLRQLMQSLPAVIIVFSRTTAREFITALKSRLSGNPEANEPLASLFAREIRLRFGQLTDGTVLDARVIFMPHASARPEEFATVRAACVDRLVEEVDRGNLSFNPQSGHLRRGRGGCLFCANSMYRIGPCDYETELTPLAAGSVVMGADGMTPVIDPMPEKGEQEGLLERFLAGGIAPVAAEVLFAPPPPPAPIVLKGKVVTMAGSVVDSGAVYVELGKIKAVQPAAQAPPPGFPPSAPVVETAGVLYPGLLDLHNHLAYNILPLWKPPRQFDHRNQWRARREYKRDVSDPMETLVGGGRDILKAIVRYIEVKLLLGGVTSGQGMKSRFGGNQFYRGLVRNFEASGDPTLPTATSHVQDLEADQVADFRAKLDVGRRVFFHLAEGLDTGTRQQFTLLHENSLLRPNLIGIHSLALLPDQHRRMMESGTRLVWSPLSNSMLYGSTIDPRTLVDLAVPFTLGSDWTPSGSRNLLLELKVAWLCGRNAGAALGFEKLAESVTRSAAEAAEWGPLLGTLEAGKLADILVLDDRQPDPFENLVRATEREVKLVVIGGQARYGDATTLAALDLPAGELEPLTVGGREKRLFLQQPGSPLASMTFAAARQTLESAMSDLEALRNAPQLAFDHFGADPMPELELDMQAIEPIGAAAALADLPPLESIVLDAATVIDDGGYFDALEAIAHLPEFLRGAGGLRGFYV